MTDGQLWGVSQSMDLLVNYFNNFIVIWEVVDLSECISYESKGYMSHTGGSGLIFKLLSLPYSKIDDLLKKF